MLLHRKPRRGATPALEAVFLYPFMIMFFMMMLGVGYAFMYKAGTLGGGRNELWRLRKQPVGSEKPMNLFALKAEDRTRNYSVRFNGGIFERTQFKAESKVAVVVGATWDHTVLPLGGTPPLTPHFVIGTSMVGAGFSGISNNAMSGLSNLLSF
jgi:hypothetical protein